MDFIFYQFSQLTFCLTVAAGSALLLQMLYYFLVYGSVAHYKRYEQKRTKEHSSRNLPSVSIVIVTKDEQENLKQRLPIILEQQYPNFEVVVVNNASSDETEFMLKVLEKIYAHLKVVNLYTETPNKFQGKKYPLSLGIKSAKNDYILLTNANCVPNSYFWVLNMVKGLAPKKNIVLGCNLYERKKTLLNIFIQYDSLNQAINYEGMALLGNPYKATGDNLIISRKGFFDSGGFISLYNISSGDMELFVNHVAKRKNTSVVLNEEAYVKTEAPSSFSAWCNQKRRRLRTAHYYKFWDKFIVATPVWTTLLFYASLVVLFLLNFPWQWIVAGLIVKILVQILLFYKGSSVLMKNKLCIFAPLFEIFFLVFNTIIGINTLFSKKERWD
ncbi:MAG: glycosyltransferase [Bacteroidales bacterium]|jgi:cellulose synthase/poly-beta-1,6-N-acetylglucosamine synthase-like glycosyltransferase|nr:glycosyltransferase [Bacteroidales bacterium]